ncbi:MAG: AAA family ATPase [Phycisphaerales bacterium]|nr:AAA family ATPase [Phycisphaerales bacterium]
MFEIREDGPMPGEPGGPAGGVNGSGALALRASAAPMTLPVYGTHLPPPARRPFSPRMLLRFKWMVALITVLGAAATIPPIWMFTQLKYYANAYVQIKPTTQRQIYKVEENSILPLYQQFVNTNVALIRSATVLNTVLDDGKVQTSDWYLQPAKTVLGGSARTAYERLVDDLRVSNQKNSELIEIGFSAPSPKDAELIAKLVRGAYMKFVANESDTQTTALVKFLEGEETKLYEELQRLTEDRGDFTSTYGSTSLEELQTLRNNEKLKLEAQLHELQVADKLTEWDAKWTEKVISERSQGASEPTTGDAGAEESPKRLFWSDREWSRLYQDFEARKFALEQQQATSNMGENHPQMRELRAARDIAQGNLKKREEQLLGGGDAAVAAAAVADKSIDPASRLKELRYVQERTREQMAVLQTEITAQEKQIAEVGKAAAQLRLKDQEIEQVTAKYKAVQERMAQVESELTSGPGRIEAPGDVRVSSKPQNDKRLLFSLAAIAGWFGLALGISYLRGMSDPSMSSAGDLTGTVHIPFLGQMPRFAPGTDALSDTSPMLLESIRMIRTALLERCAGRQGYTVLVTSPNTGSGKTTFSMLLARSLGHMGKRVLLVDTDLRRGSLTERLGVRDQTGLVDLLRTKGASAVEVAQFCERVGVDVIPTGRRATVDDAERMANGRFSTSLKEWRAKYDFVILDAAPVLPVADARILAGQTDGTIMAVRASQTRRDEALEALAELSAAGAKLFGTVLIGTDPRSGYYRGYDYGSLARREETATV